MRCQSECSADSLSLDLDELDLDIRPPPLCHMPRAGDPRSVEDISDRSFSPPCYRSLPLPPNGPAGVACAFDAAEVAVDSSADEDPVYRSLALPGSSAVLLHHTLNSLGGCEQWDGKARAGGLAWPSQAAPPEPALVSVAPLVASMDSFAFELPSDLFDTVLHLLIAAGAHLRPHLPCCHQVFLQEAISPPAA